MDEEEGVEKPAQDDEGNKVFQSSYEGEYKENMKDGEGRMEYPDGGIYEGSWKFDKRHGDGAYWYPNGDIYSGEWKFGTKHGRGTFINADSNARLIGTYADGKFVKGKWAMADSTYTGGFKDNKPFGPGEFVFNNGNRQGGNYVQKAPAEGDEEAPPLEPQWIGGPVESVSAETYVV